jgi:hypothetical protein
MNIAACSRPAQRIRMPSATSRFLLLSLIAALIGGLAFTPGLPGDFVFDDIPNIVENQAVRLTHLDTESLSKVLTTPQISGFVRTLPTLSFAFDYWRSGGPDPAIFKTTNIFIHVLTTCVLAWFFRSLLLTAGFSIGRARWLGPSFALAWALHPLQVSSVLYVVQRIQTLGTLFLVLALWTYLKARQAQIEGRSGRTGLLITSLLWILALGCKEDSVLLPAYTLALELTLLHFAAANAGLTRTLRRGYLFAALVGVAAYALIVVPLFWHWEPYPGRDFSSLERLLTQARVVCLYIWQILLPLPQHMPFYYDGLQPSRGLLQPWTTLTSIAALLTLLGLAWRMRARMPLFSLGVFLFFSAHSIASNVVGLELVFEHRNHFALIGAVLAIGSLITQVTSRLRLRAAPQAAISLALLLALGSATVLRAQSWSSKLMLAQTSTELAPSSARAWSSLCAGYFREGGGAVQGNPLLDKAIEACSSGADLAPYALNNLALLIVLKTVRGDVESQDWSRFQQRLQTMKLSFDNRRAPLILTFHARNGVRLDKQELLEALATLARRAPLKSFDLASIGYFVMNDLNEPDLALPYFIKSIEAAHPNDPFPRQLAAELRAKNRPDLAKTIEKLGDARRTSVASGG